MANTDRLGKLNMLVFKQANIRRIQDAIKQLLDIFHDVLEKDFEYGAYFSAKDVLKRLQSVDTKYWKEIKNLYLQEEYYGYCKGNFSDDEMDNPAKLIMDILSILCTVKDGVMDKIEQKYNEMQQIERKYEEMRDKTTDLYQQLLDEKRENADRKMEFANLQGKVNLMEKMVEEKSEKISELLRDKHVQMNTKEKEKVLEKANKKINELEDQIMELEASKQRQTRRMSCIDDKNKMLKMKQERIGISEGSGNSEIDKLKRDIYIKDKDIAHLEDMFYTEQKFVLGIIGGIQTDINILSEKFYIEEEKMRDPEFVKLTKTVGMIFEAASEGKLGTVRTQLPPHYTYFDKELKVRKLRRLSKQASLPNIKPADVDYSPISPIAARLAAIGTLGNGDITPEKLTPISENKPVKLESVCENPIIIDPHTGRINSMAYLQHFPHMNQNFVLDHYKKFKEFDTDHDCSLDLNEVTQILTSIGCKYPIDQIEEAVEEVDKDNSHTLDFYEYLLVVDKITKRSGKSKLFKSGLKQNQEVSKACVVQ